MAATTTTVPDPSSCDDFTGNQITDDLWTYPTIPARGSDVRPHPSRQRQTGGPTMSTTPVLPAFVTTTDDNGGQRISVFGTDRVEICGAFKPVDRPYWLMYATKTIADAADRSQATVIPHHIQLPAQRDAQKWLELIAGLYMKAADQ